MFNGVSVVTDRIESPSRDVGFQSSGGAGVQAAGFVEKDRATGVRYNYTTNVLQEMRETVLVKSGTVKDPAEESSWADVIEFVTYYD